jgi:hypothetical protein
VVDFKLIYKREGKKFGGFCTFACFAHSLCTYVTISLRSKVGKPWSSCIQEVMSYDGFIGGQSGSVVTSQGADAGNVRIVGRANHARPRAPQTDNPVVTHSDSTSTGFASSGTSYLSVLG